MIKTIEKYPVLSLLVLVLILLLPNLNELKVTIMEARNFIAAREMLSDGNWILTTMNGEPRYEKPPLPTWITAIFGLLFGIKNVFALRFPGVIMVWAIGVFIYLFSKNLTNDKTHSFINALIGVSSFYVFGIIIEAPWDIYTHGFMMVAIFFLYRVYNSNNKWDILLASVFIGFSILSKGPVSLYALLLPFILAYALVYGVKNKFVLKSLLVLIPGLVLGSIWFIYVRAADTETFSKITQVETSNWSSYNVKPFYYYWNFFLQSGIWTIPAICGLLYLFMIKRVKNGSHYNLSFFWTLFSVVLLSLIPEKKARYLMPVLIPLAINTGFYIFHILEKSGSIKNKLEAIPLYFHFGLIGIIGIISPLVCFLLFKNEMIEQQNLFLPLSLALLFMGSFLYLLLILNKMYPVFYISILIFTLSLTMAVHLNPVFTNQNTNYKSISMLKEEAAEKNIPIYVLDQISPEMLWDFGGIVHKISKTEHGFSFPKENMFGLLVNDSTIINTYELRSSYTVEKRDTYDLNHTKKYKPRYVNYYYILKKRNDE
ncbi:MAG: glycosyltransferase family 39 protein [Bacteroidales bacterium]